MARLPKTRPATAPARGVMSALETPAGALPNGRLRSSVVATRPRQVRPAFGKIIVVQPPAGHWQCDACQERGFGGGALLGHAGLTAHLVFSPR